MLPTAVAWSFSGSVAIRCVLPVLWMTSCFHTMALYGASRVYILSGDRTRRWPADRELYTGGGGSRGEVCYLRWPCCLARDVGRHVVTLQPTVVRASECTAALYRTAPLPPARHTTAPVSDLPTAGLLLLLLLLSVFSARCNILYISRLCYNVNVRLSVCDGSALAHYS